jgi:hypothetical protein
MVMRTKWITALAAAAVLGSVAVVLVQSGGQPPAERTLTGCVRTGSAPAVFVLRGASASSAESAAPAAEQQPEDYLLVSIPPAVSLDGHVNHRVAVTGVVSEPGVGPPPPAGANAAEKAIRRLAVKSVKELAQNCAAR